MPVLLAPEQAPTLQELLAQANTIQLDCKPVNAEQEPELRIRGLGYLLCAGPDAISFLSNPKLPEQLPQPGAATVVLHDQAYPEQKDGTNYFQPVDRRRDGKGK